MLTSVYIIWQPAALRLHKSTLCDVTWCRLRPLGLTITVKCFTGSIGCFGTKLFALSFSDDWLQTSTSWWVYIPSIQRSPDNKYEDMTWPGTFLTRVPLCQLYIHRNTRGHTLSCYPNIIQHPGRSLSIHWFVDCVCMKLPWCLNTFITYCDTGHMLRHWAKQRNPLYWYVMYIYMSNLPTHSHPDTQLRKTWVNVEELTSALPHENRINWAKNCQKPQPN